MQPILIIREKNKITRPNKLKVLAVEEAHTLIKIPVTPPGNLLHLATLKHKNRDEGGRGTTKIKSSRRCNLYEYMRDG